MVNSARNNCREGMSVEILGGILTQVGFSGTKTGYNLPKNLRLGDTQTARFATISADKTTSGSPLTSWFQPRESWHPPLPKTPHKQAVKSIPSDVGTWGKRPRWPKMSMGKTWYLQQNPNICCVNLNYVGCWNAGSRNKWALSQPMKYWSTMHQSTILNKPGNQAV